MKCRIVNSKTILKAGRLDGSYHNAEVNIYEEVITSHSSHNLNYYCSEIFTSGRTRRSYTAKDFGVPFLSNSDTSSANPFISCSYSSKKYGFDEKAVLKGGMILTGRVGAIGQTSFVPKFWERFNAMGSDNIIRIVVKPTFKNGFIYAFLASKVGKLSFLKHSTGGVQPFITDAMVGGIPVPDFPDEFQKDVDDLIQESARLREEANDAISQAHDIIEGYFPYITSNKSQGVRIKDILASKNRRFEASYYNTNGKAYDEYIKSHFQWKPLSELANISRPGLFKRCYVENGLMFLGGADIFLATPKSNKFVSRTKTADIPSLIIKEGSILMPRSGTIGDVAFATSQHAQKLASEDVIRINSDNILRTASFFAFLSSKIGKSLIQRHIFGSVIQHVEPQLLGDIPIPIFDKEIDEKISGLAMTYKDSLGKAGDLELKAIAMVEAEIEQWVG